jgi:outer membrane protein assembly factor BamB
MTRILFTAVVAVSLMGAAGSAPDSIMFRGGPDHLGVYSSASSPDLSTVTWKFRAAGKFFSSPAVTANTVYIGNTDHNLYAVNRNDGTLKWKFETRGAVNSSPAVDHGLVMFGSVDGKFYAVDAETGTQKWSFTTGGERRFTAPGIHGAMPRTQLMADPFDVFLSSPAISGNTVYFGSGDTHIYALDVQSGALKWKFKTGDVVHASPAVANGTVFIGSWDRYMYALNASSGALVWKFQTGQDTVIYNQIGIASSAAVSNGTVFFGCRDGHFYAVDEKTGTQRWSHDNKMGWVIASPAVLNNVVYFPTSDGTRFKALDAATGTLKFNIANKNVSFSSPAIVNDIAYFGSSDGWLHAVDTKSGTIKAEFQSDGSKANAAKYTDENGKMRGLYPDFTLEGMFVGLDRMFSLGSILSSPVVADGVLYVGSTDGNLYAIR